LKAHNKIKNLHSLRSFGRALIIYTELEVDYIEKGVKVIQKAKESLTGLYNDYKPKY